MLNKVLDKKIVKKKYLQLKGLYCIIVGFVLQRICCGNSYSSFDYDLFVVFLFYSIVFCICCESMICGYFNRCNNWNCVDILLINKYIYIDVSYLIVCRLGYLIVKYCLNG